MDETNKGVIHGRLNLGGSCTLSRLNEADVGVQPRDRFANLADEDVDSAKGDPVPILD